MFFIILPTSIVFRSIWIEINSLSMSLSIFYIPKIFSSIWINPFNFFCDTFHWSLSFSRLCSFRRRVCLFSFVLLLFFLWFFIFFLFFHFFLFIISFLYFFLFLF